MDELRIREGEPLTLRRGMKIIPLVSVDVPVEFSEAEQPPKQKTYMLKFVCPNGCKNTRGGVMTVRMTAANTSPGAVCQGCMAPMVSETPVVEGEN